MPESYGKKFEQQISQQLKGFSICYDRLKDDMSGLKGSGNIADFIVFYGNTLFYLECKTVHGNTFNLQLLRSNQYEGLLFKTKYNNVVAGVLLWFIDHDITVFIPIQYIKQMKDFGKKSIRYDDLAPYYTVFRGTKKRVFFKYDLPYSFQKIIKGKDAYGY